MARIQNFGIKFPINVASDDMTLFDLNHTRAEQVKSEIMHLVFTPKGQRLRQPDFGTRLIQYIFDPSDMQTWGDIVSEVRETVNTWIPGCDVQEVAVEEAEDGFGVFVRIRYTLREIDGSLGNYEIITKL